MALISSLSPRETLSSPVVPCALETEIGEAVPKASFARKEKSSVRTCLVTGAELAKDQMIRFVAGPGDEVFPDLAAKLPGRGFWVVATRAALQTAISKNLFTKAARRKLIVKGDLLEQVSTLLSQRTLDLLGLAKAAGLVVWGEPRVEQAMQAESLSYVLLSDDAGADVSRKMARLTFGPCGFSRAQLGAALGREMCVAVGLKYGPFSEKLRLELLRWQGVGVSSQLTSDAAPDLLSPVCGRHD